RGIEAAPADPGLSRQRVARMEARSAAIRDRLSPHSAEFTLGLAEGKTRGLHADYVAGRPDPPRSGRSGNRIKATRPMTRNAAAAANTQRNTPAASPPATPAVISASAP